MKPIYSAFLAFAIASSPVVADISVSDSFESRDLSAGQVGGLTWGSPNRTTLVTQDSQQGDMVIYNREGPVELPQGSKSWKAKDGNVSMRFDFPGKKGAWAEQRFSLASAQQEIWIRFWLRVPTNYRHGPGSPSNNKLFALWMDDYSSKGAGPSVIWEFWNDGSGGSKLAYHYSPGGHKVAGSHQQEQTFIRYPADQGRWMQLVMHVKAASGASANDGVIELYRRWEDEKEFSVLHSDKQANIAPPAGGPFGWKAGYFMGWSNPGYEAATEWLLDDVALSSSSLLDGEQIASAAPAAAATALGGAGTCKKPAGESSIPKIFAPQG